MATAKPVMERSDSNIPSGTFNLLQKHSLLQSLRIFLKLTENAWGCKHSASLLTSLPVYHFTLLK
jgi:hypothetical protein